MNFDLHIADTDISAGTIPVSWCVKPEHFPELIKQFGNNPKVVLVIAPIKNYNISKEIRKMVPLRELMTYLEFKTPGQHRIWAFLVNQNNMYLDKRSRGYIYSVLNDDGNDWSAEFNIIGTDENGNNKYQPKAAATLDVNIPFKAFAPEPPEWEKKWVNHFFDYKATDQCDFRRRRLFAYSIQPFLILLQILAFKLPVTLLALLIGARNFSFIPLLHPLTYDCGDQFDILYGGSIFINKNLRCPDEGAGVKQLVSFCLKKLYLVPFMPLVLVLMVLLCLNLKILLMMSVILMTIILAISTIICYCLYIDHKEETPIDLKELEYLSCTPDKIPYSINNMPKKKKTVKLYYQNLKGKICRPFSV